MKNIILTALLCVSTSSVYVDEVHAGERVVNPETKASYRLSITPTFKSLYDIEMVGINDSCDEDNRDELTITELPKTSYFRKTYDRAAQNDNEMIVHVYEVPVEEGGGDSAKEEFFESPFKICTAGKNYVPRSLYRRVGGLNTGVIFVPFKMRSGDIFSDSSVGPYVSYKFETVEYIFAAGISQISVSEVGVADVENKTGLTAAFGFSFEADKNWDIAVLAGVDHLSGADGAAWKYQDKMWVSFGVGFNFTR